MARAVEGAELAARVPAGPGGTRRGDVLGPVAPSGSLEQPETPGTSTTSNAPGTPDASGTPGTYDPSAASGSS
ncbi:hypothetical protein L1885_24845, partial [Streptomyces fuscigenes]|nr:hypothetical protein [Streptomyces fuscigenes]